MNALLAVALGLLEGLTEYLPVSSTGHLILLNHLVGFDGDASKAFSIVIQFGAILAVVAHYREMLGERLAGLVRRDQRSVRLFAAVAMGFAPTAVVGLALHKVIKARLFGVKPVVAALVAGGVVMIASEVWRGRRAKGARTSMTRVVLREGLEHVTPLRALVIGFGQCVALWPGASRAMCTILAGQAVGLSTATATEFSFLLGLPTLGAATLVEAYKSRAELASLGGTNIALGLVTAYVVARLVIAGFVGYVKRRSLIPFGVYRIVLAIAVTALVARG
jgi:undecaprenyl-diphosphatase